MLVLPDEAQCYCLAIPDQMSSTEGSNVMLHTCNGYSMLQVGPPGSEHDLMGDAG